MAEHEYVPGEMDISDHRKTYAVFWALTKWGSILTVAVLVLLAVTRTNAVDCSKSAVAAQHINACGKLGHSAGGEEAPAEDAGH